MREAPLFMSISVGCLVLYVVAVVAWGRSRDVVPARGLLLYYGWMTAAAVFALTGFLARVDVKPPPFALLFVGTMATSFTLGLSSIGKHVAEKAPLAALVGLQVFRLPLELVMAWGARHDIVPDALAFGGANFDIVTGIAALPVAWAASRGYLRVVWAWSILGILALATIAVVAMITSPFLQLLGPDQVNWWVARFPFCEVPAGFVVFALASHIIIARALLRKSTLASMP